MPERQPPITAPAEHERTDSNYETRRHILLSFHAHEDSVPESSDINVIEFERLVQTTLDELEVSQEDQRAIKRYLTLLRGKHSPSYEHSLQVGLTAREIARHLQLDEKALLIAGLLHDIGKVLVPESTLTRTVGWSDEDKQEMDDHVVDGVELLRGRFDFSAEVIARHHQFQARPYPAQLPPPLREWDPATLALIEQYARLLSLADVYQALHRPNDRFAEPAENSIGLTDEQIKEQMLTLNPDQHGLIESLYRSGVFLDESEDLKKAA